MAFPYPKTAIKVRSNFSCAIARRHRPASSNPKARSNVRDVQKYARQGYPE
ncbi:MAG: hypothetical protein JGK12_29420 [Microcoleus sp. PH2017_01_SCD_O_A]|uniref:hypothetical protein n=1 Tax=unclassified Microcoleus TaxID=2642155 RepID=UPI001DB021E5|nr:MULTISPECIES: hypothetical protein [unclassified Microcoleus]MCC3510462.1 hypothetical protein [Microcoleus sp. PH2017_17_BER_D_A]MCC3427926.1 hypothetical protein [Microcoleus sp. PH2017_01_SCD_O_A]MCC3453460.1 hypothetical protein [Microcoleus sp. PH2017_08_TRC_O_A]MCC3475999.1 hypothetical protein [Microcoleus sp. PH2017_13_LAR_U_A]MCC3487500.1 hypothetical protein [Microcoleus sp. PH2017_14_LAR_D_A]